MDLIYSSPRSDNHHVLITCFPKTKGFGALQGNEGGVTKSWTLSSGGFTGFVRCVTRPDLFALCFALDLVSKFVALLSTGRPPGRMYLL